MKKKILVTLVIALLATSLFATNALDGTFQLQSVIDAKNPVFTLCDTVKGYGNGVESPYTVDIKASSTPNYAPTAIYMSACNVAQGGLSYKVTAECAGGFTSDTTSDNVPVKVALGEAINDAGVAVLSGDSLDVKAGNHGSETQICTIMPSWAGKPDIAAGTYTADITVTVAAN